MLQAADVVAGVIRACAEDCLFAGWSRVGDLRDTFEKLIIEGSFGDVPQFMLSQPMFEHVIHPSLARAVTARAGLTPDPGVDWY